MFCSICGQKLENGAVFCPSCGTRVAAEATHTATPTYEPAPTYAPPVAPPSYAEAPYYGESVTLTRENYAPCVSNKKKDDAEAKKKRGASITAMVFGILSVCLFFVPIANFILALVAKKRIKYANTIESDCANGFLRAAKVTSSIGLPFGIIYSSISLMYPIIMILIYAYMIVFSILGAIGGGLYY